MFNTTLKITAFSLLSVLATASVQASQINQDSLRLVPTNTVLEGAPLYSNQVSEDITVTTYFNTAKASASGELKLLPTYSVLEGDALYSYQELQTENKVAQNIATSTNSIDKSRLQLLPTYSVLEGDALYSYQEVAADIANIKTASQTDSSSDKQLSLLPTYSVLEGDALYSYQEVKTKNESANVYAGSNKKVQGTKTAC